MSNIICDKCGRTFALDISCFGTVQKDDLIVQYFSCPNCGTKYQYLTSDKKMRELMERRKAIQKQVFAGHAKRFRRETLRKYEREIEQIKQEQQQITPTLKAAGEKILHGDKLPLEETKEEEEAKNVFC